MLNVEEHCSFASYFVLCSAESTRQVEAIREEIHNTLKKQGHLPLHKEGTAESGWILADYGSVIIHVMAIPEWDYYRLDQLWAKAPAVVRIQ